MAEGVFAMPNTRWTFAQLWNESLDKPRERKFEPRSYIWASELGGAFVDRYLRMQGTVPTNPPNPRSKRKFEAGHLWESIVGYVLLRAGVLQKQQEHLSFQYPDMLKVTGRLDFLAGGKPDYDKSLAIIKSELSWLPEFITDTALDLVNEIKEKYPDGLKDIILEIKSSSSFMFELTEKRNDAQPQHKLQIFHYLKAKDMDEGHIIYVCKDDARLIEIPVFNPSAVEDDYKEDIELMTEYYDASQQPPLETPLVFRGKFGGNWKIAYSQYLTMLYGFKTQKEFDDMYKPTAERFNRVLGRALEGKALTTNNKQAIKEMAELGFNFDKILNEIKH